MAAGVELNILLFFGWRVEGGVRNMFGFAIVFFIVLVCFLMGAVFDIDWIMKMTTADRAYGRKFARISTGVMSFFDLVVMIIILING